jgi:carboxypeptidase family protein
MTLRRLLLFAGLLVAARSAGAQSQLIGRILSDSGKPIAGATVTLTGIRYSVRTDSVGQFRLAGTPGSTLELKLQAVGFLDASASVVLSRGRPVVRDFVLVADTQEPEANPSDRVMRIHATTVDGEPIAFTNLILNGGRRFVSDDSGRFSVPINTGTVTLLLRRIGFEATEMIVAEMPDTAIRVQMKAVARTLETQVVTVRSPFVRLEMGGFYKRMAEVQNGARVGYFVTPEDLALRNPQNVTDAVEQFPSIRLAPIDDGKLDEFGLAHADGMMSRRKFRIEDRQGCPLTVYLDRIRIQPSVSGTNARDEEINSIVQPGAVAGIEVYPRAIGAPPEFPAANTPSHSGCGVVLIWTR